MNPKLIGTLGIVVVGIIVVTCNEVELRFWGLIYAIAGVLSTSFYQVWVKTRQQDLGLSPPQLLYYQAPISALMVFAVTPIFDPIFTPSDGKQQFEVSDPSKKVIGLMDY